MRVGYEWVHSLVDDHSRYAYSELHRDERAATVTGFVERGLAHFASHGIEAKRLISDNAFVYRRNRSLAAAARPTARQASASSRSGDHRSTARSSATSRPSSANGDSARPTAPATTAPPPCHTGCDYYNQRRPHSSLGGRPPISRVHNLPRQDI